MHRVSTAALAAAALALGACTTTTDETDGPAGTTPGEPTSDVATDESDGPEDSDSTAADDDVAADDDAQETGDPSAVTDFTTTEHGTFDEGWAMAFLPGTDHLLVAERVGALQLRDQDAGEVREVSGVPEVYHSGQAGLHDVVPGPTFEDDGTIYLS